jgi:adenylate cyclase class 1
MISFASRIKAYRAYNNSRRDKAVAFNPDNADFLFKIIPYLLHCNYPDLPGFVDDKKCPFGIHLFQPDEIMGAQLFSRYFTESTARSIRTPTPFGSKPFIHSLKTIGSIGTIGQTEKSDCDYWVSIRLDELGEDGLEMLEEKCRGIEQWATEYGHEIYFFLMDIKQTRENSFESAAEEESAGSALKLLLKDELFRTHILVAGKMLLWWLIPPGLSAAAYAKFVTRLIEAKKINPDNFIDLGYLSKIPREEIFGACLWQMNKALDSPFKSVIKFAYLELLLRQKSDDLPLLSNKIKRLVTFHDQLAQDDPQLEFTEIDPYLILARDIVAFYRQDKTLYKEENFMRQCLFLKTVEAISPRKTEELTEIIKLMKQWDLLPVDHKELIKFHSWSFKEQIKTGAKVHEYLIETYKRLRMIFKNFQQGTGITINERDISILGRKLYTFYDSKDNKINYVRSISRDMMVRDHLTFHAAKSEDQNFYYVFQGEHNLDSLKTNKDMLIKKDNNSIRLIAWLKVNNLYNSKTIFHLTKNYLPIVLADIQGLADILYTTFPKFNFAHISTEELLGQEKTNKALIVVNFNKKTIDKNSPRLESTIISVNSYGEYFINHFDTLVQLKNMMRVLLTQHMVSRWNNNLEIYIPPQPDQYHIKQMIEK